MMKDTQLPGRVIVMYGRSIISLVIAHSLGKQGIEVIGCDESALTVLSFSRYVKKNFVHLPVEPDPAAFIQNLITHIKEHKPQDNRPYILMPVFLETEIIAQNRHLLEPYIQIAAPSWESIQKVNPKDSLARTAKHLGVPIPQTWHLQQPGEAEPLIPNLSFPVILKPIQGMGGRGVFLCNSPESLRESLDPKARDILIQEFIPGQDYCLTVLYERGVLKASMAYRNLRRFPIESGAGVLRETVEDGIFLPLADSLLAPLDWHGIAELDFRWDGDPKNTPILIEVNTRFWAGLFQSVDAGIDFPFLLYQMTTTGKCPGVPKAALGSKTKVPGLWLIAAIGDLASTDEVYEHLEEQWDKISNEPQGKKEVYWKTRNRLKSLVQNKSSLGLREIIGKIQPILQEGRRAKNDLWFRDDPFTVLGVLYVLSYLLRHKQLPEELNVTSKRKQEK